MRPPTAKELGKLAYDEGKKYSDNPFSRLDNKKDYTAWRKGYTEQESYRYIYSKRKIEKREDNIFIYGSNYSIEDLRVMFKDFTESHDIDEETVTLHIETDYDGVDLILTGYRYETDEEYNERISKHEASLEVEKAKAKETRKKQKERKEIYEKELYEKLKKKYG